VGQSKYHRKKGRQKVNEEEHLAAKRRGHGCIKRERNQRCSWKFESNVLGVKVPLR